MFSTYLALRDTNQIRACLIEEMNGSLFYSRKPLPTLPNQATTIETILNRMEAICKHQKHEFNYEGLYSIADIIPKFTSKNYDEVHTIINEISLEELKKQIVKEQMLGNYEGVYITSRGNLVRYTEESTKEKTLHLTINTSNLNILHVYDKIRDGYMGSPQAEWVYVDEINLKSGKQYKFSNQYDFTNFLSDKIKYFLQLEEIQKEKIKAVYEDYWFKDLYSFLFLKRSGKLRAGTQHTLQNRQNIDIKQIIEYSNTLNLSKDILELEANKLVDELSIV